MKIRWKLLILMLGISLGPILLLRWNGEHYMRKLGNELAGTTRAVLIERASRQLTTMVEEHALVLRRERELLELALKLQATELERALSNDPADLSGFQAIAMQRSDNHSASDSDVRVRETASGKIKSFEVSFKEVTLLNIPVYDYPSGPLYGKLQTVIPTFKSLAIKHPEMILWQWILFKNGGKVIYPAATRVPKMLGMRQHKPKWFDQTLKENDMTWSSPTIDPLTRQITLIVSMPIHSPQKQVIGVTAIVVPLDELLQEDAHMRHLSHTANSMLIRTEERPDQQEIGIRILARDYETDQRHQWRTSLADEWLPLSNADPEYKRMLADLQQRQTGVVETSFDGVENLLVYGSIDDFGTALLLMARKDDVVAEALAMENFMIQRVTALIGMTGYVLAGVIIIVVMVALFFSRSITRNVQELVTASRRIASGDFTARAEIRSGDELGELGRTFNRMVPELEEHVQIKQALDVAMEIQQNFLPQSMPNIPGVDVAGMSLYCDETGGDFYDFLDFCCREKDTLGVVVGDVSGHGISAALLMATARALLRCRVTQSGDIATIINDVNGMLAEDTVRTSQFLTLFYMELEASRKRLHWVRAGHDAALLYDPSTDRTEKLMGKGLSMGIDWQHHYATNTRENLASGQVIAIGTDGIWETVNHENEMFGKHRFEAIMRNHHQKPAKDIVKVVTDELRRFRGKKKQMDDATLVVIKLL